MLIYEQEVSMPQAKVILWVKKHNYVLLFFSKSSFYSGIVMRTRLIVGPRLFVRIRGWNPIPN